eukprot:CAMPEP_0170562158 /NCGR_PEP_ID=MMETSP0211-20121228/59094_1 /TAXON_ID=311385 /ORGANISM="Pseudokeronopsis sp., Strain OXSARD2" /LENGTH=93 /DNA_ID=CAMNT_0010878677 /DNA_START=781 /DNA_END=1062 /DNA_ORIENTATION=+
MEELEKRKEEIMEEFLDMVFQKRFDKVEEIKANCKAEKLGKEIEKQQIANVHSIMEKKKKAGMKEIKKKLSEILMNDSISLIQRLNRLYDDDI